MYNYSSKHLCKEIIWMSNWRISRASKFFLCNGTQTMCIESCFICKGFMVINVIGLRVTFCNQSFNHQSIKPYNIIDQKHPFIHFIDFLPRGRFFNMVSFQFLLRTHIHHTRCALITTYVGIMVA